MIAVAGKLATPVLQCGDCKDVTANSRVEVTMITEKCLILEGFKPYNIISVAYGICL